MSKRDYYEILGVAKGAAEGDKRLKKNSKKLLKLMKFSAILKNVNAMISLVTEV